VLWVTYGFFVLLLLFTLIPFSWRTCYRKSV